MPSFDAVSFDAVVKQRRSVRGYTAKPVPRALVQEALALAQQSPSNCNSQPWRVYVAAGQLRDRLRDALVQAALSGPPAENTTPQFDGVYRARQVACAKELYGCMQVARDDLESRKRAELRNFELFDAPCVAIVCMDANLGIPAALDVGCYVQTFMLALTARGIACCPQASLRRYPAPIFETLGIDPALRILCGISFGYEAPDVPANQARPGRVPPEESCTLLGFDE